MSQPTGIAGTAHNDRVVVGSLLRGQCLESSIDHFAAVQWQLAHDRAEERDPLRSCLQQCERRRREDDLQRDPWDSGARPDIEDPLKADGKNPDEQQAIQDDMVDDPQGIGRSDEPLASLPFNQ
jgi:hypothetical protein